VVGDDWGDGVTAKAVAEELKPHKDASELVVYLNSPGGLVFEGIAIYNILVRHKARVTVVIDAAALSIASLIAMAGDEIRMAQNAILMIHDPWSWVIGTAEEMRDEADLLDKAKSILVSTYASRSGRDEDDIAGMMADETWLTAEEAVEAGLADTVIEAKKAAAVSLGPVPVGQIPDWAQDSIIVGSAASPSRVARDARRAFVDELTITCKETPMSTAQNQNATSATATPEAAAQSVPPPPPPVQVATGPATLADLKAALPTADNDFIVAALEQSMTVNVALAAWSQKVATENAALKAQLASKATAASDNRGAAPLADNAKGTATASSDPIAEWESRANEHMKTGKTRDAAFRAVAHEDPDLRAAYVEAHNAKHRGKR
jgi:ATP-dependent Clp protease protease subunit